MFTFYSVNNTKNQSKSHKFTYFTQKYQKNQKQKRVGMKLGHDLIIHLQDNILGRNTT